MDTTELKGVDVETLRKELEERENENKKLAQELKQKRSELLEQVEVLNKELADMGYSDRRARRNVTDEVVTYLTGAGAKTVGEISDGIGYPGNLSSNLNSMVKSGKVERHGERGSYTYTVPSQS